MFYSLIGTLALLILIIENKETLFNFNNSDVLPSFLIYRRFLITVALFYISDILWGLFESLKFKRLLFIDTSLYFVFMAIGVMFWTCYTVTYLDNKNAFAKFLIYSGRVFAATVTTLVVINFFYPVVFKIDADCFYHAFAVRYIALLLQIILLLLVLLNSLPYAFSRKPERYKYRALAAFGFIMIIFVLAQVFSPYLPLYSMAYMLGISILHTFVMGDEKNRIKKIVTNDALTGVGNKYAFVEAEKSINKSIENGEVQPFLIVVCDINDLKLINDIKGHGTGDKYIKKASASICTIFKHSRVFRIGDDEFVIICHGHDYEHINERLREMNLTNLKNRQNDDVQIAYGIAYYENDSDVQNVFDRADKKMYEHKMWLKAKSDYAETAKDDSIGEADAYKFPEDLKKAYESSSASFVYYQNIGGNPVPVLVSDGFCKNIGISREIAIEWLKDGLFKRIHPDDADLVSQISDDFINHKSVYDIVFRSQMRVSDYDPKIEHDDEKYVQIHGIGRWQTMPDGTELAIVSYANLSETQKAISETMEIYSLVKGDRFYTDPLTALPNLNYVHEHGNETVSAMREAGKTPSVIYTDIYSIQSYNNRYGVKEGDNLICLTAKTLKDSFPESLVSRGSDDHFITITGIDDMFEIENRLLEANKTIINSAGGITSGIRSGVCPLGKTSTLMSAIDRAKHTMKLIANDLNRDVAFFSESANNNYLKERYIVENLNYAINNGWIKVYYHALMRIESLKVAAFEGLARWIDPDRGMITPNDFIPVLQKYHQLHKLDLFIFEQVCREVKVRYDNGLPLVPVSVNFSMQDFDYADIIGEMNRLYEKYHLDDLVDKSFFIIEITEQDLAIGTEKLKEQLTQIRNNGYRLWLDDFGSGYSALNVFSQFDFDLIKFDMDFLKNLDSNNGINRIILEELVYLSHKFGIHTLIEGVETEDQLSFIKGIGCELAQGFYFHKPESLEEILSRVNNGDLVKLCENFEEREKKQM